MHSSATIEQAVAAKHLSTAAAANVTAWLTQEKYAAYRAELEQLIASGAWQVLEDSFFKVVPFGTGGRRGTVGVGANRINRVTIGESAQGLADYLQQQGEATKKAGVVIGYDTRLTSVEFATLTASIFAANGFKVYLFDGFRATPQLSFAVRQLACAAGVVISASHNPPADNGFKVYWSDGGQIVPPHDAGIMAAVSAVVAIQQADYAAAVEAGQIAIIGQEIDEAYVAAVRAESLSPARSAVIAYSPLHGSGSRSVLPVLKAAGFTEVTVVAEQAEPDGAFPNIKNNIPNPEVRDTSALVTEYAERLQADIAITTDPDADRLGVIARDSAGAYQFLTGNQIAALIGYHVLQQLKERQRLRPTDFVVKTIVTTDFITAMAQDFGVTIYDNILIGFKYVAELIRLNEGKETFLFGGEESHGILKGTYTRDKDAAIAALLICELASKIKDEGKNLVTQLNDLYRQYGMFWETLQNTAYQGAEGSATMARLMAGLRQNPPQQLGEWPVVRVVDRLDPKNPGTRGDVLIYELAADHHTRLTVRPSGTEPKLKIYAQVYLPVAPNSSDAQIAEVARAADQKAAALTAAMQQYFEKILAG